MASDFKKPFTELTSIIPDNYLNELNSSLLSSLFDPQLTHEEAIRVFGLVGKYFPDSSESRAWLSQSSVERQFNQLIPTLFTQHGNSEFLYTFDDSLRKAEACNIDVANMEQWAKTQTFNFAPPIDLDKFVNFSNYFWIQKTLVDQNLDWNPNQDPEYYVIAKPATSLKQKLPVNVATTSNIFLNGTTIAPEIWTVSFTSPSNYSVHGSNTGYIGTGQLINHTSTFSSFQLGFTISEVESSSGTYTHFIGGDYFTISLSQLSSIPPVVSFSGSGIGSMTGVKGKMPFAIIDGVQLESGHRILVKNQLVPSENGIYEVSGGTWIKTFDSFSDNGLEVYVKNGSQQGTWSTLDLIIWNKISNTANINEWQYGNYWVHKNDLFDLYGISFNGQLTQALRPIIEYRSDIELAPNQVKSRFNQLPQFNLYWPEGIKTPWTSGIFYYAEDPLAPIDIKLQRRIKLSSNATYCFEQGTLSPNSKRMLGFKLTSTNTIAGCWQAGPTELQTSSIKFNGHGTGTLDNLTITHAESNEDIELVALTTSTFSVTGSRSGRLSDASVGIQYSSMVIDFILNGSFVIGDKFKFSILGPEHPRYAIQGVDGMPITFQGHPSEDLAGYGAWLTPPHLVYNPLLENRAQMIHGDLTDHFISIIKEQTGFDGSPFGKNNYRQLNVNTGLGGEIKVLDSSMNLLLGLLNQENSNPISLIDFAEKQYSISINSLSDYLISQLPSILSENSKADINILFEQYKTFYTSRSELNTTYHDTSSPIPNWPLTLPLIGIGSGTQPIIKYDFDLKATVLVHHDGHESTIAIRDIQSEKTLALTPIVRFNGEKVSGSVDSIPTSHPYKGQLWFDTIANKLKTLAIQFEGLTRPGSASVGDYWYDRTTDILQYWDGITWVQTSVFPWISISINSLIDNLTLVAEQALYDKWVLINANNNAIKWTSPISNQDALHYELSRFAIANGYDPLGSNYVPTDAFTWNYHLADFSNYSNNLNQQLPTGIARWHKLYNEYFKLVLGPTLATSRPDIEPWKLMGNSTKPSNWDSLYKSSVQPEDISSLNFLGYVDVISLTDVSITSSLLLIDSVSVTTGNTVLLINQFDNSQNGVYNIVSGNQLVISNTVFNEGNVVAIKSGTYKNSIWVFTNGAFVQARIWSKTMWDDINAYFVANSLQVKVCVNTNLDTLLPPYVSNSLWESQFALTTTYPLGITDSYSFGDEGPVELVWKRSSSYNYSLARVSLSEDPLNFLRAVWGYQTFTLNGLTLDRYTGRMLSHNDITLHAEPRPKYEVNISPFISATGSIALTCTLIAVYQQSTGKMLFVDEKNGYAAQEGETTELIPNLFSISIPYGNLAISLIDTISSNGYQYVIGDKINIVNGIVSFVPSTLTSYIGINQWYTQFLRYMSLDIGIASDVAILRNSTVKLGYRIGSMVETDTLKLSTDTFGKIPENKFTVKLKTSNLVKNSWAQALRIQVIQIGSDRKPLGSDTEGNMLFAPTELGTQWVFRIENYFGRHPQIEKYMLDSNGTYETFSVLDKKHCSESWYNFKETTGLEIVNLPITITGIQNVVTFIEGYSKFLKDQGWEFAYGDMPPTDPITNRLVGWQLEIEKFIDTLYRGTYVNKGLMLNPMLLGFSFTSSTGLLSPFKVNRFDDIMTSQFAFDLVGDIIQTSALSVVRSNDQAIVRSVVPMFGAHINTTNYEHMILFENYVGQNTKLIFDSFLGIMLEKITLEGKLQQNKTFRPTFGGYYLDGHQIKKNIVHSIDSVSNFYNPDSVFETEDTTKHALSLFGFNKKSYFDLLNTSDKSQFNFWRGLINAKGTNYSIDAFLNSIKFETAEIDEFWAYKLAHYGDARTNVYPELKLNVQDCVLKHTRLFFQELDELPSETFITINATDENRWYSLVDLNTSLYFEPDFIYETYISVTPNEIVEVLKSDHFEVTDGDSANVIQLNRGTVKFTVPGTYTLRFFVPSKPKFSPIKLLDYVNSALIEDITTWHPAFGNHSALAYEVLNTISETDPAKYNYSTLTVGNKNYDPSRVWGKQEVGRTWWDTTNLEYIPYYDDFIYSNFEERLARWGSLAEYSKVKVYEWIESTTKPNDYDAGSAVDQLIADIPSAQKRTGTAARKQTYSRNRSWKARPIAWSFIENPSASSSPTILNYGSTSLSITALTGTTTVVLNTHRFSDFGITSGMHLSAWADEIPYGELILTGTPNYMLGKSNYIGSATAPLIYDSTDFTTVFLSKVKVKWTNNVNFKGNKIGELKFKFTNINTNYFVSVTKIAVSETETDFTQKIQVTEFLGDEGTTFSLDFQDIGIQLEGTFSDIVATSVLDIWNELSTIIYDVYVRQYSFGTILVPFPTNIMDNTFSNLSPSVINDEYGWRAWKVPTQKQLVADLKAPLNGWKSIVGKWTDIETSSSLIGNIKEYENSKLMMNDGSTIEYYLSTWNDWNQLTSEHLFAIGTGSTVTFTFSNTLNVSRLSVYVNGINQLSSFYSIDLITNSITTVSNIELGHKVVAILSSYEPSSSELSFDPLIKDDVSLQIQYKVDYQYATKNIRDSSGNITGQTYYFWVENKTVPGSGKNISIQQAQQLLTSGPDTYLTFQKLALPTSPDSLPIRYKGVTIAGLNLLVGKDNTYKLRFTRDFILRDDPNDIQLKNSHTEWLLIRPNQNKKIPLQLWQKLVDSACGKDSVGNKLPSLTRQLYDERHLTSTRYGFGPDQVFADTNLILASLTRTIMNPKTTVYLNGINTTSTIQGIDFSDSSNWFSTPEKTRHMLDFIWNTASAKQINELFFEVMQDALANNYEFTDIFKTSRLSAHSIITANTTPSINNANVYY
jgi:hypothetical protein